MNHLASWAFVVGLGMASFVGAEEPLCEHEGKRRGPPAEAISACDGMQDGDACAFEGRRGTVEGTCRVTPFDENMLACVPAHHDRGGDRGPERGPRGDRS